MRFGSKKHKKSIKNFGVFKKVSTFAHAIGKYPIVVLKNAEIAQLVEHNLAKVGVASSSLVFRSKLDSCSCDCLFLCQNIFCGTPQLVERNLAPRSQKLQPWQGKQNQRVSAMYAEIAQLVEHNLAKVGVASSSLVFRSKKQRKPLTDICEGLFAYPNLANVVLYSATASFQTKISRTK